MTDIPRNIHKPVHWGRLFSLCRCLMEGAEQEFALLGLPDVALGQLDLLQHLPLLLVPLHVVHAVLHLGAPAVQHLRLEIGVLISVSLDQ